MSDSTAVAVLGALLLALGTYGALARRDLVGSLIGVQIALVAGVVTLAGLSRLNSGPPQLLGGDALGVAVAILSGAQALLGAALAVLASRRPGEDPLDTEAG